MAPRYDERPGSCWTFEGQWLRGTLEFDWTIDTDMRPADLCDPLRYVGLRSPVRNSHLRMCTEYNDRYPIRSSPEPTPVPDAINRLNGALVGRYEIQRQLGECGMANVCRAVDLRHDHEVAFKVLQPEVTSCREHHEGSRHGEGGGE